MAPDTATVIDAFNEAFQQHDPGRLVGLIADDCVLENTTPAPNGDRIEGRDACIAFWRGIAEDASANFELEQVIVTGDRATILWRLHLDGTDSVRGVNLMRVRDGKISEALGYVKGA